MLILKCFNISILNGLRSNHLKHISILNSYQTFSKRNYILETTKIKFLNGYEDSLNYVKHMKNERNKLAELVNDESQLDNYDNKQKLFQRLNDLNQISAAHDKIIKCQNDIKESSEMLAKMTNDAEKDDEMFKLINDDLIKLNQNLTELKFDLINLLIPDEIEDKEDAVLELSAGVGGLESRIFCSELFEMYRLYSANREWSFTPINIYSDQTEMGEMMRGAVIDITGKDVYKWLKFESGVHRVQRVPKTESKGRIHTSTVGVVVTPKV
jgi:peptide chain release factor 1